MPYITQDRRNLLDDEDPDPPETCGELNYVITTIIRDYWLSHKNYQGINDIMGALEGAKLEFYARVARPYEDTKILANGDVYV